MTKKDNSTPQAPAAHMKDFFAEISEDLQMQVERFSHQTETEQSESDPLFSTVETQSPVQSASSEQASEGEDALFDSSNTENGEHSTPQPSTTTEAVASSEAENNEDNDAINGSLETIEFGGDLQAEHSSPAATSEPPNESHESAAGNASDTIATSAFSETTPPSASDDESTPTADADETIEATETMDATENVENQTVTPESPADAETAQEQEADATPLQPIEAAETSAESSEEESATSPETADTQDPDIVAQQAERKTRPAPTNDEQRPFRSSPPDTALTSERGEFTLTQAIAHSPDRTMWQAQWKNEENASVLLVHELSPARYRAGYQHLPDLPEIFLHRPFEVIEQEERVFLLFEQPGGFLLQERLRSPDHHWTIGQLRRFVRRLADSVHRIHKEGYLLLQLNDQHIWVDEERNPWLFDIDRFYNDRTPIHMRPIVEGFSAPELYNHQLPVGPHSDVFSIGALLHYLISQCPSFNHLDLPHPDIPSPRIYQLDFPVGLDHVIHRATHYDINRRYADIPEFVNALERALREIEERHRQPRVGLQLNIAHDIHIGINKGMRNPVNQDGLFWRYDRRRNKGLFLIADGVSHCHYGSGDRASSILIQAARQCWDALVDNPIMDGPIDHRQRRRILNTIFSTANRAIAQEVNQLYDRVEGYVEDVMGSTCVGGFLDANQITLANLGDSRAYLKTEHYIEQVSIDHDYKTAQLQIGQDIRSLQNLMGGSLITRCVGSCRKDEQYKVVPLRLQPDFFDITLLPGDTIVLCSDGLSDYAGETEEEAREMLSKIIEVHTEPISACFWLIALANQRGGGDNISVIEIKVLDTL